MRQNITKLSAAVLMVSAIAGAAHAGGFSRGTADTDIIYEDGTVDFRAGGTYVSPHRSFDTIAGATATDDRYSNDYWIPSASVKVRMSDSFSCAATYTQSFGGNSTYGKQSQAADKAADVASPGWLFGPFGNSVKSASFTSDEVGGTCAYNTQVGPGNVYFLGGLFLQNFKYTEVKDFGTLNLTDKGSVGYRIGAAYEIKEYALRGQIMYRSQVDHDASGEFTNGTPVLAGAPLFIPVGAKRSATGAGTLPQSLEVSFQSGIAPDWLAFGSVKWTDWSVFDVLNYNITNLGAQKKEYYWQDGWTVSGGIGHKFNDNVSGAVSLTWDRGVSTGADIMTDTWTLGAGSQIKAGPGTLRLGAAVSYLTSGEQSIAQHAAFNATAGNDWAYALNASYIIKF